MSWMMMQATERALLWLQMVCLYAPLHTYIHMHTYIHTRAYTHTHAHTHTFTHMHTTQHTIISCFRIVSDHICSSSPVYVVCVCVCVCVCACVCDLSHHLRGTCFDPKLGWVGHINSMGDTQPAALHCRGTAHQAPLTDAVLPKHPKGGEGGVWGGGGGEWMGKGRGVP